MYRKTDPNSFAINFASMVFPITGSSEKKERDLYSLQTSFLILTSDRLLSHEPILIKIIPLVNLLGTVSFQQQKHLAGELQMSHSVCRNDFLIIDGLCFHITCFICIFFTTPMFELVKTVTRMLYIVQKAM